MMEKKEHWYIVDGYYVASKELDLLVSDVKLHVYRALKHYWVYLNDKLCYEFDTSNVMEGNELLDFVLETTIEKWGVPKSVYDYSHFYCGNRIPNGLAMVQHEKAMDCVERLQSVITQEFIDNISVMQKLNG